MGQQAYRPFEPLIETIGQDEAAYCRARSEVETRRAGEAAHSAARDAHLEMAALYQQRALAAHQIEDPAVQEWMSEGGSWLADA
jgi:hypothetical protein